MNSYFVLVRFKDEPGSAVTRAYINADNPYSAIQMAKALYGRLLLSESVTPV